MVTKNAATLYGGSANVYLDLVRRFPLRPLRSKRDLDEAVAIVDELVDREELSKAERDYLDVLGDLVESYEKHSEPVRCASDKELLQFLMTENDVSIKETSKAAQVTESAIAAVLEGKRKLTRTQIGRLSRYFHVEPNAFLETE